MRWANPYGVDLGILPLFLHEADPRPAKEQIHERYAHGGGWFSAGKLFKLDPKTFVLTEANPPGPDSEEPPDPPLHPLASTELRDEKIFYYQHSWVAIVQPDGSFDVARID